MVSKTPPSNSNPKEKASPSSADFPLYAEYGMGYTCEPAQVWLETTHTWLVWDSSPVKPGHISPTHRLPFRNTVMGLCVCNS